MTDPAAQPRIFLVVVDESEEMRVALRYAALRARRTGGHVALLYVIEPSDLQQWMAVESLMREERREEAEALLQKLSGEVAELSPSSISVKGAAATSSWRSSTRSPASPFSCLPPVPAPRGRGRW
jgi:nucleotide-binding universal stress UspA family protein